MFFSNKYLLQCVLIIFLAVTCGGCAGGARMGLVDHQKRPLLVDVYLAEFCAQSFMSSKIGAAIRKVMLRLPDEALKMVLDRRRPVLFVDVYSHGLGKIASSTEFIVTPKDGPVFQEGMTIVKLSDTMEEGSTDAIMGVVVHELAHRVMDNIRRGDISCQAEKEINHLIKAWGFAKEFEAASKEFGKAKQGDGVASCQDQSDVKK